MKIISEKFGKQNEVNITLSWDKGSYDNALFVF